ncbi:calcium-activated potassium channel subunit beta-1 isoform X7 [Lepidochelys kempii]|uniref:calcium-activated potassium channel subunit beta-1 isoform X7 n=1 Tax=Lepidochelys kempii TaxID=8472 RepID=UPI003C6F169B
MLGKKLVTAQKRGETRALCLGLGMVACSVMMYFFVGITIMPSYVNSVWTKETTCKLLKTNIKDKVQCSFNNGEGDENIFQYPCLEVLVDLNFSGQEVMLYHTEETQERNPKISDKSTLSGSNQRPHTSLYSLDHCFKTRPAEYNENVLRQLSKKPRYCMGGISDMAEVHWWDRVKNLCYCRLSAEKEKISALSSA